MKGLRELPPCGHQYLRECPLTVEDWAAVWAAWRGFLYTCKVIATRAHAR